MGDASSKSTWQFPLSASKSQELTFVLSLLGSSSQAIPIGLCFKQCFARLQRLRSTPQQRPSGSAGGVIPARNIPAISRPCTQAPGMPMDVKVPRSIGDSSTGRSNPFSLIGAIGAIFYTQPRTLRTDARSPDTTVRQRVNFRTRQNIYPKPVSAINLRRRRRS